MMSSNYYHSPNRRRRQNSNISITPTKVRKINRRFTRLITVFLMPMIILINAIIVILGNFYANYNAGEVDVNFKSRYIPSTRDINGNFEDAQHNSQISQDRRHLETRVHNSTSFTDPSFTSNTFKRLDLNRTGSSANCTTRTHTISIESVQHPDSGIITISCLQIHYRVPAHSFQNLPSIVFGVLSAATGEGPRRR